MIVESFELFDQFLDRSFILSTELRPFYGPLGRMSTAVGPEKTEYFLLATLSQLSPIQYTNSLSLDFSEIEVYSDTSGTLI